MTLHQRKAFPCSVMVHWRTNYQEDDVLSSDGSTGDSPPAKGFSMQRYGPLEDELPRRRLFDVPRESGMYFRPVPAPALFLLLTSIK